MENTCQLCGADTHRRHGPRTLCFACEADVASMHRLYRELRQAERDGRDGTALVCELMGIFLRRGDFTAQDVDSSNPLLQLSLKAAVRPS